LEEDPKNSLQNATTAAVRNKPVSEVDSRRSSFKEKGGETLVNKSHILEMKKIYINLSLFF
jgi:hypothetical protein